MVLRDIEISRSWALILEFYTMYAVVCVCEFFCVDVLCTYIWLSRSTRPKAHLESLTWREFEVPLNIFHICCKLSFIDIV